LEWYVEALISSIWESLIFTAGCAAIAIAGVYVFGVPFVDGLGLVLLIVGAGLMLIGGAMSFVSPGNVRMVNSLFRAKIKMEPDDFRKQKQRAALYAITGVLVFGYSLLLATVLG